MNPAFIAAAWLALGLLASAVLRRQTARLVAIVPLAGAGLTLLTARSQAAAIPLGGLSGIAGLDRTGEGVLVAAALSLALVLLLQPSIDVSVGRTIGVVGASATIAMASSDPLLTALALTAAVATLVLRWIGQSPGRATLAAGRVAGTGTMALVAASPFLPLTGFTTGDRPIVVAALLAAGVAALLAVYPLGGWAAGIIGSLKPLDVAPWLVLLVPVVLIIAERIPGGVLGDGSPVFEHVLLVVGLGSAVWGGIWAAWGPGAMRYGRVFMADIALCIAAVEGAPVSPAMTGALIIVLTHLCVAPILLRPESAGLLWPRRVAWALLSGVPPSSTFWGRLLLLEALAAGNVGSTIAAVIAMASIFVASVMACSGRALPAPGRGWRGRLPELAAWLLLAVGIAIGLAPQSLTRFVFGV
ncbi:MAG TPA: hypothetical protein VG299_09020 [Candidatus Dormibacteraeota bacterium]|nr:hypothetical protein [Candidatus Dormibacteraeota bacterium]